MSEQQPYPLAAELELALAAAFSEAISLVELQQWAERRVAGLDNPPDYLLELLTLDGSLAQLECSLTDVLTTELTNVEQQALAGIADRRGINRFEPSPSPAQAAKALQQSPQLLVRFCQQFPFIVLE